MDRHDPKCAIHPDDEGFRCQCTCGYAEWCEFVAKAAHAWADAYRRPYLRQNTQAELQRFRDAENGLLAAVRGDAEAKR